MSINVITDKGDNHITSMQADSSISLDFLSVFIGSGAPPDSEISTLKAMEAIVSEEKEGAINSVKSVGAGKYAITVSFDNNGLENAFDATEIVIKVKDPEDSLSDYIFIYTYEEDPDHLPVVGDNNEVVEHTVTFTINLSGVTNPAITLVSSANISKTDFGENSILKSDEAENPASLTVPVSTLIGRKSLETDKISALSVSEVRKLLSISDYGCRHAIQSWGNGVDLEETTVKGNGVLSEVGNGTSRSIDFGLDFTNKHGMVLLKNNDSIYSWIQASTLFPNSHLQTDSTNALSEDPEYSGEFTSIGMNVGSYGGGNANGDNIAEFAFHCPHEKVRKFENVKSVVFDFADNWLNSGVMALRSIEFLDINGDVIPLDPATDFTAYSTSEATSYEKEHVFNTSLTKIGVAPNNSWIANNGTDPNRLIIVFNDEKTFKGIIVNNYHYTGYDYGQGVKNTKIYTSLAEYTKATYGALAPNLEKIFDGQIAQHVASDVADDKYYCGVTQCYNPATGFFMMVHDGDGGTADFPIRNWMGKPVIFSSTKNLNSVFNHISYNRKIGAGKYLVLNDIPGKATNVEIFKEMSETQFLIGNTTWGNASGERHFTWGWVGEDLGHITPEMWGVEGSVAIHKITDGGTFDCGIDESKVKAVIVKRLSDTSYWYIYNKESGWDKYLFLNESATEYSASTNAILSFEGSILTVPDGFAEDELIIVIGEDGDMPAGNSINIRADETKPTIFSIADGFDQYGPLDHAVIEKSDKVIATPSEDGLHEVCVDEDGNYSFESERPDFDSTPGVMRGTENKLPIMKAAVMDSKVVDIDPYPVGNSYEVGWWPVEINKLYSFENLFKSTKVDFDIWWNSEPTDENKRWVTGQFYDSGGASGMGAYKRISKKSFYIGLGNGYTYYSRESGDSIFSTEGYYKLVVRRLW